MTDAADGHGGIQSIQKVSTSGLVDTYRITLADTTFIDIPVTNGRSITGVSKTGTSGLVDTHTIKYNDGTTSTFTVTNGAKGDKGDNTYTWIKYASQQPTEESHSMGDIPDDWIGIYYGNATTAPSDWKQYQWFQIKGEKGDTGDPASLISAEVTYQVSDSGTIIPSGEWSTSVPVVPQGKYLWTRMVQTFNTGSPITAYSVSRMGIDGSGAVSSVSGVSPDESGDVPLTAADVGALPSSGGDVTGEIRMNGQPISGLNEPTEDTQAAPKSYVDKRIPLDGSKAMTGNLQMGDHRIIGLAEPEDAGDGATKGYVDGKHFIATVSLPAAGWAGDAAPYTQTVAVPGILETDTPHYGVVYSGTAEEKTAQKEGFALVDDLDTGLNSVMFTCLEEKPEVDLTVQLEVNR